MITGLAIGLRMLSCLSFVHRAMRWAKGADDGFQVVIVGDCQHPEVIAVRAYTEDTAVVVNSPSEAESSFSERLGVVLNNSV